MNLKKTTPHMNQSDESSSDNLSLTTVSHECSFVKDNFKSINIQCLFPLVENLFNFTSIKSKDNEFIYGIF